MTLKVTPVIRWFSPNPNQAFRPEGPLVEYTYEGEGTNRNPVAWGGWENDPVDWVIGIIGLSDKNGTPLPDNTVEDIFIESLKSHTEGDEKRKKIGATFHYQVGDYGGYREPSLAVEAWPMKGESLVALRDRVGAAVEDVVTDTNQNVAIIHVYQDGKIIQKGRVTGRSP